MNYLDYLKTYLCEFSQRLQVERVLRTLKNQSVHVFQITPVAITGKGKTLQLIS